MRRATHPQLEIKQTCTNSETAAGIFHRFNQDPFLSKNQFVTLAANESFSESFMQAALLLVFVTYVFRFLTGSHLKPDTHILRRLRTFSSRLEDSRFWRLSRADLSIDNAFVRRFVFWPV